MNHKRSSYPTSASIVGGLDDLLIEILLFSPAKSLIKFKSVSKHWKCLISSPSFCHLHTLRHRHRPKPLPNLLLLSSSSNFFICNPTLKKLIPFHFFRFPHMNIMQSCNGLLLLECRNSPYGQESYFVYNPTTMQRRNLSIKRPFSGLCLSFDPIKSPHYKVTRFSDIKRLSWHPMEYEFSIHVYESETHTWKHCQNLRIDILQFHNGIYWNDGIYFIRPGGKSFCFYLRGISDKNVVHRIDKPQKVGSRGKTWGYASESNGNLHFIRLSLGSQHKYSLSLCELNKGDRSWFKKYCVDLSPITVMFNENYDLLHGSVLGIIRGGREEDSMFMFHGPGKIIVYRFYDKSFKVLVDFTREDYYEEGRYQFDSKYSYQFTETLAPV